MVRTDSEDDIDWTYEKREDILTKSQEIINNLSKKNNRTEYFSQ